MSAHAQPRAPQADRRAGWRPGSATTLSLAKLVLLPLVSAAPLRTWLAEDEEPKSPEDASLWVYLSVAIALVLLGGAFAGLTIALMGQDETYLHVLLESGETAKERKNAGAVLGLLKKGKHWVLVTLLLSNVITNETLPIVLDRSLGGGWPAVLSSTVLIVIFGEIAPQSVCVRYGLSIGAWAAPFVLALMWLMSPIAWPTAKLLDYLLGEDHGTTYKKAGLKSLVQLHQTLGTTPGERLMEDEVNIIKSVLDLKDKSVAAVMTPMDDVFTMSADTVLDEKMMDTILSQGYSRIPVYAPDNSQNFIGMLLVKILITYDPEDAQRVRDFALATLPETAPHTSCLDIINFFQEGKSHMVLVSEEPGSDRGAQGVVTLEDVIEELIGEEIVDESDVFIDVHKAIRRMAPASTKKYKMKHGQLIEDEGLLSEAETEQADREDAPLLTRKSTMPNGAGKGKPPGAGTTFLMRRKSSTASDAGPDGVKPVTMRGNATDMRKHLAHLGPSNAASKPKPTKYTSVKIKPGVSTIPENRATSQPPEELTRSQSYNDRHQLDERAALLGVQADGASGGAEAVRATYGTNDTTSSSRPRGVSEPDHMSASEASRVAEEHAIPPTKEERSNHHLQVPGKASEGEEDDLVGEIGTPFRQRSKSNRRTARSGSITETTVNVGNVQKIVLEAGSSSSDETSPSEVVSSAASKSNLAESTSDVAEQNGDDEDGGRQEDGKKKKRKGKKKKKGGAAGGDR